MIEVYYLFILVILTLFAIYDALEKRVPNKALACFAPIALLSPLVSAEESFFTAFLGVAIGFTVLLAPAIASQSGNGVGGGDIKLAALLGFIYGPWGIIGILLIASLLAAGAGLYLKKKIGRKTLRLAFVPFLAIGSFIVTAAKLFV